MYTKRLKTIIVCKYAVNLFLNMCTVALALALQICYPAKSSININFRQVPYTYHAYIKNKNVLILDIKK